MDKFIEFKNICFEGENEVEVDLKAKFRDWKKTSGTAGIREKGTCQNNNNKGD